MNNLNTKNAARVFADAFAEAFAGLLTEAVKSPAVLRVLDHPDLAMRQDQPVHYRLTIDGASRDECFIELYQQQVADLGSMILGRPVSPFSDDHADALGKVISSSMAKLTESLAAEFGELHFKVDRVADLAFGGMLVVPLSASVGERSDLPMFIYFDGKFLETLSSQPSSKHFAESGKRSIDPINLKLVMDVELSVSLRFGQRQLPLREVLGLASGSIIELDRQVDAPIELLLDGKVIARGEAVIVDGNYGLRVTDVPQPIASHLSY